MIIVTIKNDCFEIKGHALFAKYGNDIVCASVSTMIIMTINQVELCGLSDHIEYQLNEGLATIKVLQRTDLLEKILNNLEFSLIDLAKSYPNYLKITK